MLADIHKSSDKDSQAYWEGGVYHDSKLMFEKPIPVKFVTTKKFNVELKNNPLYKPLKAREKAKKQEKADLLKQIRSGTKPQVQKAYDRTALVAQDKATSAASNASRFPINNGGQMYSCYLVLFCFFFIL